MYPNKNDNRLPQRRDSQHVSDTMAEERSSGEEYRILYRAAEKEPVEDV